MDSKKKMISNTFKEIQEGSITWADIRLWMIEYNPLCKGITKQEFFNMMQYNVWHQSLADDYVDRKFGR